MVSARPLGVFCVGGYWMRTSGRDVQTGYRPFFSRFTNHMLIRPLVWLLTAHGGAIVDPHITSSWLAPRCSVVVVATRDRALGLDLVKQLTLPDHVRAMVLDRNHVYTNSGLLQAHAAGRLMTLTLSHENLGHIGDEGDAQAVLLDPTHTM
jgi:hypothetical protein